MLHSIVYISNYIGEDTRGDLDAILESARRRNAADDITGLLLFHDESFCQVLEGPKDKVVDCYARIVADLRHRGCILLDERDIERRQFADWDMAYIPFAALDESRQQGFIDLLDLRNTEKMDEVRQDRRTSALVNAFLKSFRDARLG